MTNTSKDALTLLLGSKTVSYKAEFAKVLGSVPAAVMLSQAFFWQENAKFKKDMIEIGGKMYFAKTSDEWRNETGLSKDQQKTARNVLVSAGMMKEVKYGMPATIHFHMDLDATVDGITRYNENAFTVDGKPANNLTGSPRTSSGQFRKVDDGKPDDTKKRVDSSDSKGGEGKTTPTQQDFNDALDGFIEAQKKKKDTPGAPNHPTHTITTIEPGNPVTVVEGITIEPGNPNATTALFNRMGLAPKATNGDEADALIVEWAKENIETVKMKYNRAKRKFTPDDLDKLIVKFCGQYASNKDTGTMQRFLYDPARFFNDKLSAWLVDQPGFEKMAAKNTNNGKSKSERNHAAVADILRDVAANGLYGNEPTY